MYLICIVFLGEEKYTMGIWWFFKFYSQHLEAFVIQEPLKHLESPRREKTNETILQLYLDYSSWHLSYFNTLFITFLDLILFFQSLSYVPPERLSLFYQCFKYNCVKSSWDLCYLWHWKKKKLSKGNSKEY